MIRLLFEELGLAPLPELEHLAFRTRGNRCKAADPPLLRDTSLPSDHEAVILHEVLLRART